MKHFVKGGNHVSNDIRIWWVLMFLLNIEVFNIMTPHFPYTSENETKCTILYQKFRNFKLQDFSLFKNVEEN